MTARAAGLEAQERYCLVTWKIASPYRVDRLQEQPVSGNYLSVADECVHGMNPDWCGICKGVDEAGSSRVGSYGFHGGETKQDVLDDVCDLLGVPHEVVSEGSSLPSHVFEVAARRVGVPLGSMPEIGEAVVRKSGGVWTADCDSRGTLSGGGSTVTLDGIRAMRTALRKLLRHRA